MRTISQVADFTGVSVRTLQYYDEINLLKPTAVTDAGYRLYDETALEKLQQILFLKELGFQLRDIREMLEKSDFDKIEAYKQQKILLRMKRNRLDRLIALLEKLERGETCMDFKKFDLTEYISALEAFKDKNTEEIIKRWGGIENFEQFIQKVQDDESSVAEIAIKQFGSVEKYTEAMKYNLEHFSELMERADAMTANQDEILQKSNDLYVSLTSDKTKDVASDEIQNIVQQIVNFSKETSMGMDMGEGFWDMVIESYSDETVRGVTDKNYGEGASEYIARALRYYFHGEV